MAKITVLNSFVYNKIAAGEVIERPLNVVKELVENSIDAGCSRVKIAIEGGGIDYIEVSDNGCGIDEDDMAIAFTQHATSKIYDITDLFQIETLGFRGEALASISSVSEVTMTSRTPFFDTATRIELVDGLVVNKDYLSSNIGTRVQVNKLFANVPARLKFLKTVKRESTLITHYVAKLILTNPLLEVTYSVDGVEVYNTKGTGLEEALFVVYGKGCLSQCIPINATYGDINVKGYIGIPTYSKANSTYQTTSINGRYVADKVVASAVKQAYVSFLTTRTYPFFVLDITMPVQNVDVNAHPSKMEVRFANPKSVYVAVSYPIKEALQRFSKREVQRIMEGVEPSEFELNYTNPVETSTEDVFVPIDMQSIEGVNQPNPDSSKFNYSHRDEAIFEIGETCANSMIPESPLERKSSIAQMLVENEMYTNKKARIKDSAYFDVYNIYDSPETEVEYPLMNFLQNNDVSENHNKYHLDCVEIMGVFLKTYLFVQVRNQLLIIDQHAAHERIVFDKLMKVYQDDATSIQMYIGGEIFEFTDEEADFIEDNLDQIRTAGIELQRFGTRSYRVTGISGLYQNYAVSELVNDLLSYVKDFALDGKQLLAEQVAKRACRKAVKAGDALTDDEVGYLVQKLFDDGNLQCPHGRPIIVELTKTQLEKMFKRIV